jgi:mRNA-degrading endonuclease RelE of RelBE toxin-antitoxin system|tara:strand:+ start:306 stop:461 length:156 start_codon:yes stop_codon:yes gene_type:complete
MYSLQIDEGLMKKLDKLRKKNRKQVEIILKKADEVVKDPHRYKNLRAPLNM